MQPYRRMLQENMPGYSLLKPSPASLPPEASQFILDAHVTPGSSYAFISLYRIAGGNHLKTEEDGITLPNASVLRLTVWGEGGVKMQEWEGVKRLHHLSGDGFIEVGMPNHWPNKRDMRGTPAPDNSVAIRTLISMREFQRAFNCLADGMNLSPADRETFMEVMHRASNDVDRDYINERVRTLSRQVESLRARVEANPFFRVGQALGNLLGGLFVRKPNA